jgi:hypothetical protein
LTKKMTMEVNRPVEGSTLWWLGNAGFAMRYDRTLLLIDPVIKVKSEGDPAVSECGPKLQHELPLRATEIERADLATVTHSHGDHTAPKTLSVLNETGAIFIYPQICLPVPDRIGVDAARVRTISYDCEWPCPGQWMTYKMSDFSRVKMYKPNISSIAPITCIGAVSSPRKFHAKMAAKNGEDSSARATWLAFTRFSPS